MTKLMNQTDIYKLPSVREIDDKILRSSYNIDNEVEKAEFKSLLETRKKIMNAKTEIRSYNKKLLMDFNEALRQMLIKSRKEAMKLYDAVKSTNISGTLEAVGFCQLGDDKFPDLNPNYDFSLLELWQKAHQAYHDLYDYNSEILTWRYHGRDEEKKNWMKGIEEDCSNHNKGLDVEETADLHITEAAEFLLNETPFSILDLIYVREFDLDINCRVLYCTNPDGDCEDELDWSKEDYISDEDKYEFERYI